MKQMLKTGPITRVAATIGAAAAIAAVLAVVAAAPDRVAAQEPAFTGEAPSAGQIALLVTAREVTPDELAESLGAAGCTVVTLGITEAGAWVMYVPGAPSFVRCRASGASGGSFEARPDLAAELRALPEFPGMVEDQAPVATGEGAAMAFFWVPAPWDEVSQFYADQLPDVGWTPVDPAPVVVTSDPKDDGTTTILSLQRFEKDGLMLTVGTRPNVKDPERGETSLSFEIVDQD